MGKTSEKMVAIGFTPRIIVFSFVFSILWAFLFYAGFKQALNLFPTPPLILLLMVEAAMINLLGKKYQFTIQEWTVFSTIAMSGLLTGTWYGGIWAGDLAGGGFQITWVHTFQETYYGLAYAHIMNEVEFPEMWLPRDPAVLEPFRLGGAIPWAAWGTTLVFWISSYIFLYLSNYFFMLMFRKPWIDVERIPYPALVPTYGLLVQAKSEEETGRTPFFNPVKNKVFWIPFILGCLFGVPEVLSQAIGLRLPNELEPGAYGISLAPYLGTLIPGMDGDAWGPWGFAWSWIAWCAVAAPLWFWVPMDLLKSTIIWMLLFWYVFPIALLSGGVVTEQWQAPWNPTFPYAAMFGPEGGNYSGWMFGIAAWLFFRYRSQILHTFKSALAGSPREQNEPHSWRFVWVSFIICVLAWWGIMMSSGIAPAIIMSLILWLVTYAAFNRIWADVGRPIAGVGPSPEYGFLMDQDALSLTGYSIAQGDVTLSADAIYFGVGRYGSMMTGGHEITALAAFKVASMTGTDSKSIGWAYIIALIIGISFHIPLAIWMSYQYGWSTLFSRVGELGGLVDWGAYVATDLPGSSVVDFSGVPNFQAWVLAGTVVVFVLSWLHTRFAWWFFNPIAIGVAGGCMRQTMPTLIFFFVLKWLILRIGGARAYEKIGVPAVMGLWIGVCFLAMILKIAILITGAAEFMFA